MRNFTLIIFIFSFLFGFEARAESDFAEKIREDWRWSHFDVESGLATNLILNVYETPDGTLWAQTAGLFCRFDGYKWIPIDDEVFREYASKSVAPGFEDELLVVLGENLYVLRDSSHYLYDLPENIRDYEIIHGSVVDEKLFVLCRKNDDSPITSFFIDDTGIKDLDPPFSGFKEEFTPFSIRRTKDGTIWLKAANKLYAFRKGKWKKVLDDDEFTEDLRFNTAINYKGEGFVSAFSYYGKRRIFQVDSELNIVGELPLTDTYFENAAYDENGLLVAVLYDHKVLIAKNGRVEYLKTTPVELDIASSFKFNRSGDLMCSTSDGLYICRLSSELWNYYFDDDDELRNINSMVFDDSGNLWVASGTGIGKLNSDGSKEIFRESAGYVLTGMTSIQTEGKAIWASSGGIVRGALKFENDEWRRYGKESGFIDKYIHKIDKDKEGNLWFLTLTFDLEDKFSGIYFKPAGSPISQAYNWSERNGIEGYRFYDMEQTDDALWFGAHDRLIRFVDGKVKTWIDEDGLPLNGAFAIKESPNGEVWFSNRIEGMFRIVEDTIYKVEELSPPEVSGIWEFEFDSSGGIWITTESGLLYHKNDALNRFDKSNGLRTLRLWPILLRNDKVLVGSMRSGVYELNLDDYVSADPKVYIDDVFSNEDRVIVQWKVFAKNGLMNPENIFVSYRIDDDDFSEPTLDRQVAYYDLPPGKHTFEIRAVGTLGKIGDRTTKVELIIPTPVYQRPVFYIPVITAALLGIIVIFLHSSNKIKTKANQIIEEKNRAIEEANVNLEKTNARIEKQKAELQELNAMKDNFFSIIAHDLKNPFNAILGSTQTLNELFDEMDRNEIKSYVELIDAGSRKLFDLLESLLQWSRAQSGRIKLNPQSLSLSELIDSSADYFRDEAEKKGIRIVANVKETEKIIADRHAVSTVLRNLISNAVKYGRENSAVRIRVEDDGDFAIIKVADRGPGLRELDLEKLFRLDADPGEIGGQTNKGAGLGLLICKNLVELSGGKIEAKSKLGEGSEFSVYLPRR